MSAFPWDSLKAETLRSVARDLGLVPAPRTRDTLIRLISTVDHSGLDDALEELKELKTDVSSKRKSDLNLPPPKRTRSQGLVGMVTRYKGARTKSYRASTRSTAKSKGRSTQKKPSSRVARTFDGVVLPARRRGQKRRQESSTADDDEERGVAATEDPDAEGDADPDAHRGMDVDQQNTFHVPDPLAADDENGSEKENESPLAKFGHDQDGGDDALNEDVGDYLQSIASGDGIESAAESKSNEDVQQEIVPEFDPPESTRSAGTPTVNVVRFTVDVQQQIINNGGLNGFGVA